MASPTPPKLPTRPPVSPPFCVTHPSRPLLPGSAPGKGNWVGPWVTGLTLCSLFLPPLLAWLPIPLASFPSAPAPPILPAAGPLPLPRPLVFRFSADGRPLLEGGGAATAGSLLLAPLAGWPRAGLRLLGAPSPPEEQLLPVRLSPVGAYSPPARGDLPCLASPELALLLSPLFPRSSTFPAAASPLRQVPAPPLPRPPRPPKAPRWTRSPPPPPRLRKKDRGQPRVPRLRRGCPAHSKAPPILAQTYSGSCPSTWADSKFIGTGESGPAGSLYWAKVAAFSASWPGHSPSRPRHSGYGLSRLSCV